MKAQQKSCKRKLIRKIVNENLAEKLLIRTK